MGLYPLLLPHLFAVIARGKDHSSSCSIATPTNIWLHPGGAAGRDRHHRRPGRAAAPGRPSRPRSRPPLPVPKQYSQRRNRRLNFEVGPQSTPQRHELRSRSLRGSVNNWGQQKAGSFDQSWVMQILPYMEEQSLRDAFDPATFVEPYTAVGVNDANVNGRSFRVRAPRFQRCFAQTIHQQINLHRPRWQLGSQQLCCSVGRGFLYPGWITGPTDNPTTNPQGWQSSCFGGVMGPNVAVALRRVTDGTSKTIMLGEIRAGLDETDSRGVSSLGHAGASLIAMYGGGSDANGPNAAYSSSRRCLCSRTFRFRWCWEYTHQCAYRSGNHDRRQRRNRDGSSDRCEASIQAASTSQWSMAACSSSTTTLKRLVL